LEIGSWELTDVNRRTFLKLAATAPIPFSVLGPAQTARRKNVPVGIEIFTLRAEEEKDRMATLQAIADMGYDGVEFYGIYFDWTTAYAKEVRKRLDALGLRCFSNHTRRANFAAQDFAKVIELNHILGSKYVIMAHSEKVDGEDDWKRLAATLTAAHEQLRPLGLSAGFHNYPVDFRPIGDTRPIDILAAHTPKDFCFQVDTVGTLMAGADLVAFVKANAGRVKSYHLKDWKPGDGGGRILLGEGIGDWKALFDVAESVGGVEYYLIEQEGSRFTPMETAKRSLELFRTLRGT
jgi:sugar phosphate isomerase/epimerase